jgi:N-carbamoylputrescine amidase
MSMKANVAVIQMACGVDDSLNVEKGVAMVRTAAQSGANIICLQELYSGRYFPQTVSVENYRFAVPETHPSVTVMGEVAREMKAVVIVPFFEYAMDGVYFNSVVVYDADGTKLGKFRKVHIPDGPQYHEKFYFTPGDTGYPVFVTKYGTIAVGICWDEWFPEVARIFALKGAQILFYPSAIGSEPDHPEYSSRDAWQTVIRAHGIANNVFIAAVNRVGQEDAMTFYGNSFISNPNGDILACGTTHEMIVQAEVDLREIRRFRDLLQFHRDRRPETYGELMHKVIAKA